MPKVTLFPLIIAVLFIGCGDDAAPADPGSTTGGQTIVEIAQGNEDFETLVAAVGAAGLVDTLNGDGPFTVFAPTDAAFEALPDGVLDALLADPEALGNILTYHVVPGNLDSGAVVAASSLTTVQGDDIQVQGDALTLNNSASIEMTDIVADNGVIHVIDAVLLPPSTQNIPAVADSFAIFSTLLAAVDAAGLTETLNGEGPFTVFAPTDAAFAALPEGTVEALLADIPTLTTILTYHVLAGDFAAADVLGATSLTSFQGEDIQVQADAVTLNGDSNIVVTDVPTLNGTIHAIDKVLLPPSTQTIPTVLGYHGDTFSTLLTALDIGLLGEILEEEGPYTLFAPTNAAFEALPDGALDGLIADVDALNDVLHFHAANGALDSTFVVGQSSVTTLLGVGAAIDTSGPGVTIGGANISTLDVVASNGLIHFVDNVLLPPM